MDEVVEDDNELIDVTESEWYRNIKQSISNLENGHRPVSETPPGVVMRISPERGVDKFQLFRQSFSGTDMSGSTVIWRLK